MNKNILKILLVVGYVFGLSACAVKEHSADDFKSYTAKQILHKGQAALAKKDYRDATKYFEAIDALYPFDPEAQQGQLEVISAYYKAEDYASTLAAANRYIYLYPEGERTDYAYYMKGLANFDKDHSVLQKIYPRKIESLDTTNLREAFVNFEKLVETFPKSKYAADAKKRMGYIRNLLADRELQIAKFYFDRKAYVAAANRASALVQHFVGALQIKDALNIMVKSYRFLGLDKQANDAKRVLELNFPTKHTR